MRASDAAAIADILFQSIDALANSGRQLTDDARHRFAGRLKGTDTPTIRAYPLSLEPDPIHPSSYYLAVDGLQHNAVTPLLLRFGVASSPASGLFPKSVLIGRMRPAGGREVVVNAIAFGPTDREPIRTFTEQVTKSFQPRPEGGQPAIIVSTDDFPAAFQAFRQLDRSRPSFAADFADAEPAYFAVLWAAVRAGWRDGFSLGVTGIPANPSSQSRLESLSGFTRYSVAATDLEAAAAIYDHLRRLKMRSRGFDFELDFRGLALPADVLGNILQSWRAANRPAHSIVPPSDADLDALSAVARQHNVLLTIEGSVSPNVRCHRWLHNVLDIGRE